MGQLKVCVVAIIITARERRRGGRGAETSDTPRETDEKTLKPKETGAENGRQSRIRETNLENGFVRWGPRRSAKKRTTTRRHEVQGVSELEQRRRPWRTQKKVGSRASPGRTMMRISKPEIITDYCWLNSLYTTSLTISLEARCFVSQIVDVSFFCFFLWDSGYGTNNNRWRQASFWMRGKMTRPSNNVILSFIFVFYVGSDHSFPLRLFMLLLPSPLNATESIGRKKTNFGEKKTFYRNQECPFVKSSEGWDRIEGYIAISDCSCCSSWWNSLSFAFFEGEKQEVGGDGEGLPAAAVKRQELLNLKIWSSVQLCCCPFLLSRSRFLVFIIGVLARCILQLAGQPVETFVETITTGRTGGLDVPAAVTECMKW